MGAILKYILFCCVVIVGVITALAAGLPVGPVGQIGVWTVSAGAIVTVVARYRARRNE